MAAITGAVAAAGPRGLLVRSATAQASTGQTDWVQTPHWAKYAIVRCSVTATAGTTPICLLELLSADPVTPDDATAGFVGGAVTTTGVTSTGTMIASVGPGITGIANDVAFAVSGISNVFLNDVLPQMLGIKVLNDRTTGDETYTYTVTVEFRK